MSWWKKSQARGAAEEALLAAQAYDDVREQILLLAADADEQNAWLHPCGWTRDEPYVHIAEHEPCAPMGELYENFEWPNWKRLLSPVLDAQITAALNSLSSVLEDFFSVPYEDEIATLDSGSWAEVRQLAKATLALLDSRRPIADG